MTPRRGFSGVADLIRLVALSLFIVLLLLGAVIYSVRKPRPSEVIAQCGDHLRQIGLAITMYANDNSRQFPSDLASLIPTEQLSPDMLVCPNSGDKPLRSSVSPSSATLLSGNHCSYVYVGAGLTSSASCDAVVAFELPGNHEEAVGLFPGDSAKGGGTVMYGDTHVRYESFGALVQLVPELEAGRNPPVIVQLTPAQAEAIYNQRWLPKLAQIKNGTWVASLPRPAATQPSPGSH